MTYLLQKLPSVRSYQGKGVCRLKTHVPVQGGEMGQKFRNLSVSTLRMTPIHLLKELKIIFSFLRNVGSTFWTQFQQNLDELFKQQNVKNFRTQNSNSSQECISVDSFVLHLVRVLVFTLVREAILDFFLKTSVFQCKGGKFQNTMN